uniref:Isoform 3 of UNC5C-like protein n=1 Tax=Mus musculus TaxID=10090 RepID=Q6R653-3|nr:unnamed protein product [Mus musculus]
MWMIAVASWFHISTSGMESAPSVLSASGERQGLETKYVEILRFQASEEETWAVPPPVSQPPLCNRLPPELFEQLQMLLEPNSVTGNDWRRLASHLGLCGMKIRDPVD